MNQVQKWKRWNRNGTTCESEDRNDVTFTGQRIRWKKDSESGSCIELTQQMAIDEVEKGFPSGLRSLE